MAFEVSKTGYNQIDPLFAPGYNPEEGEYHNIGQLETPYQGKKYGSSGDYGPPQATTYYTDNNRNYPYVLDSNFRAESYLPTQRCCFKIPGYSPCYESKYPNSFIPSNYFSPKIKYPFGHATPINKYSSRPNSGTPRAYFIEKQNPSREGFSRVKYGKLITTNNNLVNTNNFYPFGENFY